jgi:hypothetical protein
MPTHLLIHRLNSRSRHHRAKRAGARHLVALTRGFQEALQQPPLGGREFPRAPRRGAGLVGMQCRRLGRDGFGSASLVFNEGIKLSIVIVIVIVVHFG